MDGYRSGGHNETTRPHEVSPPQALVVPATRGPWNPVNNAAGDAEDTEDHNSGGGVGRITGPHNAPRSQARRSRNLTSRDSNGNPIPRDPSGKDAYGLEYPRQSSRTSEGGREKRRRIERQMLKVETYD